MPSRTSRTCAAALVVGAVTLTGCRADVGTEDSMSAKEVGARATQVLNEKYAEQAGVEATVTCDDDLTLDTGQSVRCELSVPGDDTRYGVTVRANDDQEGEPTLSFKVDNQPLS